MEKKLCEYCDNDSTSECLHLPFELVRFPLHLDDECYDDERVMELRGNESTDIGSSSDEEGSWFITPWSWLKPARVEGDDPDPNIGVQLIPWSDCEKGNSNLTDKTDERKRKRQKKKRDRGKSNENKTCQDGKMNKRIENDKVRKKIMKKVPEHQNRSEPQETICECKRFDMEMTWKTIDAQFFNKFPI